MKTSDHFVGLAKIMSSGSEISKDEIIKVGERVLVCPYNGKPGESLDTLRYKRLQEKVAKSSKNVEAKCLSQLLQLPSTTAYEYVC